MSRKQTILLSISAALSISLGLAWLSWALLTPPEFYSSAIREIASSADRRYIAQDFTHDMLAFANSIEHADCWSRDFTEHEINCWLAEELPRRFANWLPDGVDQLCMSFSQQRVHIGFHCQHKFWKGVLSVTFQPKMLAPNELALRIEAVRAGLVRIPLDRLLSAVEPGTLNQQWRIEWRQDRDCDVAIVHLDFAGAESSALQSLVVEDDALKLSGSRRQLARTQDASHPDRPLRAANADHSDHR